MHRPTAPTAALLAAALLSLSAAASAHALPAPADSAAELKAGREALGRGDGPAAVSLLESALLKVAPAERSAVLDDLRRAYERAAAQAEAAGDAARARLYRDNLRIITRTRPSADPSVARASKSGADAAADATPPSPPESGPTPLDSPPPPPTAEALGPVGEPGRPAAVEPSASPERPASEQPEPLPAPDPEPIPPPASVAPAPAPEPSPLPMPGSGQGSLDLPRAESAPIPAPAVTPETPRPSEAPAPAPEPSPGQADAQAVGELIRAADAAFRSQKYEEAGRIYSMLAQRGQLPESHKQVWAYCRFIAVARRINAQPSSPAEWSAIHAEIREVRALAPEIWFSEYLRRLAVERSAEVGAKPSAFIVRGQSGSGDDAGASASWQVLDSENFRIYHADPALADRVARRAEQARSDLFGRWSGAGSSPPWAARCSVYLYPNGSTYTRMTGQPADSPGFSTLDLKAGQVAGRRIHLRADADRLVDAVVPHEVSHVVLADLFPKQQIPRWADEGMAVLAEPPDAQADRLAALHAPLSTGRLFRTGALLTTGAMPNARDWDLYMAQSASLAQYLIELDSPRRFLSFLRESDRLGPEAALRQLYGFKDLDDLHARWLSHARRQAEASRAGLASVGPESTPRAR